MNARKTKFSGRTPSAAFEGIRAAIMHKQKEYFPPIDGHEVFGFTSALFHRLIMEEPGMAEIPGYQRRFFRTLFRFSSEWPKLGEYTAQVRPFEPDFPGMRVEPVEEGPPLVLNLGPLFVPEGDGIVNVRSHGQNFSALFERYEKWDVDVLAGFAPGVDT
jgi:hypothetical protein